MNNENNNDDVLKRMNSNIQRILGEKGMTQSELADALGTSSSNVSDMLSDNSSRKFDIKKLVKISQFLNVSTDELLGMDEIKRPDEEITLADVFQKLFELDSLVDFNISEIDEENHTFAISFKEQAISEKLKAWSQLKNCAIDKDLKDQIIKDWKKRILSDGITQPKNYRFRNCKEVAQHAIDICDEKAHNQK